MTDPDHRALRRAAALRHHPDRGGDPAEFARVMAALDALAGREDAVDTAGSAAPSGGVTVVRSRRSRAAGVLRRRRRAVLDLVRRRLPRSVPGSRRYGRL